MTVAQLKRHADSRELTLWQAFFEADARLQDERRQEAQKEAELKRWVNSKD